MSLFNLNQNLVTTKTSLIKSDIDPNIKKYRPWRLNDSILEQEVVIQGIKNICDKIEFFKKENGFEWYDIFIKKIVNFLKKKSREYNDIK